ncbi:MAG: nickel-dependent hydrogenase large subunit [Candidatus Heimdallarchaeota archaeon]
MVTVEEEFDGAVGTPPAAGDYRVIVGPQHPTHKEPMRWTFYVTGEKIEAVGLRLGYNHRGIEKAFEQRTWLQNLYLAERLCGICSNAHQLAYVNVCEKLANLYDEVPERAKYLRVLVHEMERIHSHLLYYGVLAHDAAFDSFWHLVWRDREIIMDLCEKITGNRVNYAFPTMGGARRDVTPEQAREYIQDLKILRKKVEGHKKWAEKERTFYVRLKDVVPLSREKALKYCAVGPTARASGVPWDVRKDDPFEVWDKLDWKRVVYHGCDLYDTMRVRIDETFQSIDQCIQCLEWLQDNPGDIRIRFPARIPPNEVVHHVEAQRGEDIHYGRSNGTAQPDRYKIRAPTLANLPSLCYRLKGAYVADIPVAIRSIDPCIGCCERIAIVKTDERKVMLMTTDEIRARGRRFYKHGSPIF